LLVKIHSYMFRSYTTETCMKLVGHLYMKWIYFAASRLSAAALVKTATNTPVPHSVGEFVEQLESHSLLKNDSAPST